MLSVKPIAELYKYLILSSNKSQFNLFTFVIKMPSSKLKRDSTAQLEGLSETDRLLLEKDEEIRRMQDILKQMQEKLQTDTSKRDSVVNV